MGTTKTFYFAATTISALSLLFGIGTLRAQPDRPNPHKPVRATDLVLGKKVSLKGGHLHASGGGGVKTTGVATGFLGEQCNGAKYAIVVGISDYPGVRNDLEYADKDAEDMANVLATSYGFLDGNIHLLTNQNATRLNILNAIDAVRAWATPDDEVVFTFSGHGMTGVAADGDTEKIDEAIVAYATAGGLVPLWDGELREAFRDFPTSRIVFIFDACMAGGMDDLQESGRVLLMASDERGYAYEGPEWDNGEFTHYLLAGIAQGQANTHDYGTGILSLPGEVTAEEAFDYAKANCVADSPMVTDEFSYDLLP